MKHEYFILTEGGQLIGLGHIMRCASLYHAFIEKGITPNFIINGDKNVRKLSKEKYLIFNWLKERYRLLHLLKDSDCVIVDSYLADLKDYQDISKQTKLLVSIDDNKRINYPRGIVINSAINAQQFDYPHKNRVSYLLGNQYALLRKEFWNVPKKIVNPRLHNIMITFGGDDLRNLTPKILLFLINNYPKLIKNVIIGKSFKNIREIKKVADSRTKLIFSPSAQKMRSIMLNSDIAISAAGQTLNELSRVGLPTITVVVATNQLHHLKGWQKTGFVINAGAWNNPKFLDKIKNGLNLLESQRERTKRSKIGRLLVDGKGSERIVDGILRILKKKNKNVKFG